MKFRDYQLNIIEEGLGVLNKKKLLYLAMEVRTGKTLTSLGICQKIKAKTVLFITKKKAISSIEADYKLLNPPLALHVINYESLHKIPTSGWDVIVCDEAHSMGAFPKPSKRAKQVKNLISLNDPFVILLSGTPTPESYSQMYHQVFAVRGNPFEAFKNFYAFAKTHVRVTHRNMGGIHINDYSNGLDSIIKRMEPYMISYTQKEAGFATKTKEHVLYVDTPEATASLIKRLKKDLVIEGSDEVILADTAVKLMTKVHQMCSGTVKFESGASMVLDYRKAEFIAEYFKGKKIAIFYKFKEELNALKKVFSDALVTELDGFKETGKNIALQIVSGREGISLKEADCLVYYNIDFSATSYWQSRDRMTTKERLSNNIYWVFSNGGIESDIYKTVIKKKDYTLRHFNHNSKES